MPEEELRVACRFMGQRQRRLHCAKPENFDAWDAKYLGELMARVDSRALGSSSGGRRSGIVAYCGRSWWMGFAGDEDPSRSMPPCQLRGPCVGVELSSGAVDATPVAPAGRNAQGRPTAGALFPRVPLPRTYDDPAAQFDLALQIRDEQTARTRDVIRRAAGDLSSRSRCSTSTQEA